MWGVSSLNNKLCLQQLSTDSKGGTCCWLNGENNVSTLTRTITQHLQVVHCSRDTPRSHIHDPQLFLDFLSTLGKRLCPDGCLRILSLATPRGRRHTCSSHRPPPPSPTLAAAAARDARRPPTRAPDMLMVLQTWSSKPGFLL